MTVETKYPVTMAERLALGPEEVRLPASFEEFVELLEQCEFSIEYQDESIIFMSIASDPHERIVANFLGILYLLFRKQTDYHRYGSNRHVFIPEFQAAYSPDASVVFGAPQIFEYSKGKSANLNPWLIVEVLSDSTRLKDWGDKLTRYKSIESLQYIIFVEQDKPLVTVFSRVENDTRWQSEDFNRLDLSFDLNGNAVSLSDVYDTIVF
jgi:Uma2 family endonuclease